MDENNASPGEPYPARYLSDLAADAPVTVLVLQDDHDEFVQDGAYFPVGVRAAAVPAAMQDAAGRRAITCIYPVEPPDASTLVAFGVALMPDVYLQDIFIAEADKSSALDELQLVLRAWRGPDPFGAIASLYGEAQFIDRNDDNDSWTNRGAVTRAGASLEDAITACVRAFSPANLLCVDMNIASLLSRSMELSMVKPRGNDDARALLRALAVAGEITNTEETGD